MRLESIDRNECSITYEWFCPLCGTWNKYIAYKHIHEIQCRECRIFAVNCQGKWELGEIVNSPMGQVRV